MSIRTYSTLSKMKTFKERFEYLKLDGIVAKETFGTHRYLNQLLYNKSALWKKARDEVIVRDCGCDLGVNGYEIRGKVIVHHMNPITVEDIVNGNPDIFNPEYLIAVSHNTHQAIHYSNECLLQQDPTERSKNDTCPWRHS